MKYAPFPVIAAVHGRTTSGGCVVALHASTIVAAQALHTGFRERWVAIVPGWGGVTQMLARWLALSDDPDTAALRAFEVIADARTTRTAAESRASSILRPTDIIVADHHQAIAHAKSLAIATASTFKPPPPPRLSLASRATRSRMLQITDRLKGPLDHGWRLDELDDDRALGRRPEDLGPA
jgi:3-hydroxyacyl-CoA dehydrogenase